ncbi:MAG: lipid-A-disaccharide synthase [Planctomycetaceae bacterium]|jgi:lipid-A-disaccharide synthase|nr:lipid-A-disaccharide synthase [Planctomycetaceae bacterium]
MKLFFSAGEPSGDIHAAALMRKLRERQPDIQFIGFGGDNMRHAGCNLIADLTKFAIMWLTQAVAQYFTLRKLLNEAKKYLRQKDIDAVILVDYPGFNWHVAKLAKKYGIPVFYFMPPQIWSWARWRIHKMRRNVDVVLAPLKFEQLWFEQHGVKSVFIGHPFFEEIATKESNREFLEKFYKKYGATPIITILPGSRVQEINANIDDFILAIEYVKEIIPNIQPIFAAYNQNIATIIHNRLNELNAIIPIITGQTTELIRAADCCLAVSGSVSLELLACNKPTVVYYKIGKIPLLIQRFFRRTKYITLVNLLAINAQQNNNSTQSLFYNETEFPIPAEPSQNDRDKMIFPEFLTAKDRSKDAAAYIVHWLTNQKELAAQKRRLATLLRKVDKIESPLNLAANTIIDFIKNNKIIRE